MRAAAPLGLALGAALLCLMFAGASADCTVGPTSPCFNCWGDKCMRCKRGYWQTTDYDCRPCPARCSTCRRAAPDVDHPACTSCKDGYVLLGSLCVRNLGGALSVSAKSLTPKSLTKSMHHGGHHEPKKCEDEYEEPSSDGSWDDDSHDDPTDDDSHHDDDSSHHDTPCPEPTWDESAWQWANPIGQHDDGTCVPCSQPGAGYHWQWCKYCHPDSPATCVVCEDPNNGFPMYVDAEGACQFCTSAHEGCLSCEDGTAHCTACDEGNGYFADGQGGCTKDYEATVDQVSPPPAVK